MEKAKTVVLASLEECTGCAACANACTHGAIRMTCDDEGFFFPHIDEKLCAGCLSCQKSCPVLTISTNDNNVHPDVYALWSQEDRGVSSSGGAFSAFARSILANGGFVYGAAFDEDLHLRHIQAHSFEELNTLRGSKYVQSEIRTDLYRNIKKQLLAGIQVLFCGTPCQVAGLKSYLRKDYENLLTLDLICHGVPSGKTLKNYIKKLASRVGAEKISAVQFRRLDGWGKSPTIQLSGKFVKIFGIDNLYMAAFDKSALFRKSCYKCLYAKLPRQGDCSLGDFWGIGRHGEPFNYNPKKGVSLVIVNNEHGQTCFDGINDAEKVKRSIDEALIENHNITHVSPIHPNRDAIIAAFNDDETSLESINRQFHLLSRSLKSIVKEYADRCGFFDIAKMMYNFMKIFQTKVRHWAD